jgi:hypothetical protein
LHKNKGGNGLVFVQLDGRPAQNFTKVNRQIAQKIKIFFVQYSDLQNQKYFAIIISESEREIKRDYTLAQGNLQS